MLRDSVRSIHIQVSLRGNSEDVENSFQAIYIRFRFTTRLPRLQKYLPVTRPALLSLHSLFRYRVLNTRHRRVLFLNLVRLRLESRGTKKMALNAVLQSTLLFLGIFLGRAVASYEGIFWLVSTHASGFGYWKPCFGARSLFTTLCVCRHRLSTL